MKFLNLSHAKSQLGLVIVFAVWTVSCGSVTKERNSQVRTAADDQSEELLFIPIHFDGYRQDDVQGDPEWNLTENATAYTAILDGCASGLSGSVDESTLGVEVFRGDTGCLLKLTSFTIADGTYTIDVDFNTWKVGNTATFQKNGAPESKAIVTMLQQLGGATAIGDGGGEISPSDLVSIQFAIAKNGGPDEILSEAGMRASEGQSIVISGSSTGPAFVISSARFIGVSGGAAQLEFSMECTGSVSGTGDAIQCGGDNILGIKYKLVEDKAANFAVESTPSYSELVTVMSSGVDTVEGSLSSPSDIVAAGGNDQDGNTLINGGFFTDNSTPLIDPVASPLTSHLNMMLIVESAAGGSFSYYNIDLSTITQ